jgi:hypothetical protein
MRMARGAFLRIENRCSDSNSSSRANVGMGDVTATAGARARAVAVGATATAMAEAGGAMSCEVQAADVAGAASADEATLRTSCGRGEVRG